MADRAFFLVGDLHVKPGAAFSLGEKTVGEQTWPAYEIWYNLKDGNTLTAPQQLFPGDIELDGDVDLDDVVILKQNFGTASWATWGTGDLDGDRDVDLDDFVIHKKYFACISPVASPEGGAPMTMPMAAARPPIPKPTDLDGDGAIDFDDFCILLEQTQGQ